MGNLMKWGSYDMEAAEKESASMEGGSTEFFKLKVGKNVVRFLPPKLGMRSPFRVVWTHYIRKPDQKDPVSFACPSKEANRRCPVCEKADGLKRSGNEADYKRAFELFPKRRVYAHVIDRENPEKGVQVLGFGKTIHEALVKIRKDPDAGGDFTDPEAGFDIIIEREGTGAKDTNYQVMAARKQSKLGDLSLIEQQGDLDRFGKVLEQDELMAKLRGEGGGEREPAPKRERTIETTAKTRRAVDDVGSSDEDDVDF